ncbi:tyrosine-type recombinase/integrase [Luteibacter sp. PPL554]
MAVELKLTQKLLDGLSFERPIIGVTRSGQPIHDQAPAGREWRLRDSELPGLQVRVTAGTVGWYVDRRMGGKAGRLRSIGTHPELTVAEARARGRKWLALMAEGRDPLVEKKAHQQNALHARTRDRLTLAVAYRDFQLATAGTVKPSTVTDRKKVEKWMVGCPLWAVPIVDIDRALVVASLDPLRAHLVEGKPRPTWGPKSLSAGTLHKLYTYLQGAYQWAAIELKLPVLESPFAQWRTMTRWPQPQRRTSYLRTQKPEGVAWLKALVELQQRAHDPELLTNRPDPRAAGLKPHTSVLVDFFVLVLLWGTRRTETARLRWSEVRFDDQVVFLAPETTKSGKVAAVPLGPWATEILQARKTANERWRPDAPNDWVFPSRQHGKPIAEPRNILETLQAETGLWITAHDLRRTMATEIGMEAQMKDLTKLLVAGAALHHAQGKTGGAVAGATEGYLMDKAGALRPLFVEREQRLRRLVGLSVPEPDPLPLAGNTAELLQQALSNPEFQRAYLMELAKR